MTSSLVFTAPDGVPVIEWSRSFDAPVSDVYRAHADPELVAQWLGPAAYKIRVDTWNLTSGGAYRFVHIDPEGQEYVFHGVFHTARPDELIIQTFEFAGYPDVVSIEVLRFEDLGEGGSRLVGHSTYPSQAARDSMAQSGMEAGMAQGYDRLDAVVSRLRDTN